MKNWIIIIGLLGLVTMGCGKGTSVEGRLVDGEGNPISGTNVAATQEGPAVKGYDRFETTSGSDGNFHFTKLYPDSNYVLSVSNDEWIGKKSLKSGPKGETLMLEPFVLIVPFYKDNRNGTVTANSNGLIWTKNAYCSGEMNWDQAMSFCKNLKAGECGLDDHSKSGDWRLATKHELSDQYYQLGKADEVESIQQYFDNFEPSSYYWSSTKSQRYAGGPNLPTGVSFSGKRAGFHTGTRGNYYAWCVRGRK